MLYWKELSLEYLAIGTIALAVACGLSSRATAQEYSVSCAADSASCASTPSYDRRQEVRSLNAKLAADCAARAPSRPIRVKYHSQRLCRSRKWWFDEHRGSNVAYWIWRHADGIHLLFKTRFYIEDADEALGRTMLARSRECLKPMAEVWARYGIKLDIALDSDREPRPAKPDLDVILSGTRHGPRRSTSSQLFYWGQAKGSSESCRRSCEKTGRGQRECDEACENLRQNEYCLLMLHEMGHWLGLPDEYAEPSECPDRPFISEESNPGSVMNEQNRGWENIDFMPRHLRAVLGPACPTLPLAPTLL